MSGPIAAGKSSYDLIDPQAVFDHLLPETPVTVLDAACGAGAYALALAERLAEGGLIVGVDLWAQGVEMLRAEAVRRGLKNVRAEVADLGRLPLADASVDVCLLATVLHDLAMEGKEEGALREIARVLRPEGVLAVIEFDKVDGPPGPPAAIRLTPEETEALVLPHGYRREILERVGPFNYFLRFRRIA